MLQTIVYIAIIVVAGVFSFFYLSTRIFSKTINDEIRYTKSLSRNDKAQKLDGLFDASLPAALRNYLRYSISDSSIQISNVYLEHTGFYRTRENQKWYPIIGKEYFISHTPNFIWYAELNIKDILKIRIREKYLDGKGNVWIKLYSLIKLGSIEEEEADQSALTRYVSEMVWFPPSLITNKFIRWEAIDKYSFKACIYHNGLLAEVTFYVNEYGQIIKADTNDIYRHKKNAGWTILYDEYMEVDGLKVPTYCESIWKHPKNEFSYAKFNITKINFNKF